MTDSRAAASASGEGPVLVVGATGALGHQIAERLLANGKRVRALIRPTSKTEALQAAGVELVLGDLMRPESLTRALDGVDSIVSSAAGYTGHTPGDTIDTDYAGNENLADAAAAVGVRRFVFTSILTCDQTPNVPHFWAKKVMEDRLAERGVPFVSLRPGAFLDMVGMWGGSNGWADGRLAWVGSLDAPLSFVYTADLAGYLAAAVDAPVADGEHIDIGWDRALNFRELARIGGELLGRDIDVFAMPPAGRPAPDQAEDGGGDLAAMVEWFGTGRYVADTRRQGEVFGPVPTAEGAVRRRLAAAGLSPKERWRAYQTP